MKKRVLIFLIILMRTAIAETSQQQSNGESSADNGKSKSSIKVSASPVSPEEHDVQNNLKKIADWRSYLEASKGNTHIASRISRGINFISDPVRRMECFNRFFEIAFSYPIDAADPGTRSDQLFAFYEVSRMVAGSAEARYDEDNLWEVNLRRLKRLQQEMLRVQAFFDGKDKQGTFKGKPDEWKDYRDYVKRKYDGLDDSLSDKRKSMAEQNNDELKQALRECARQVELEKERRRGGPDVKADVGDL